MDYADYLKALKRPFTNWKRFGLGCLFGIIPIVNLLSFGYIYRVIAFTLKRDYSMPGWSNKKELFINGFLMLLIFLIMLVPIALLGFFSASSILTAPTGIQKLNIMTITIIIQLILMLIIGYLIPVMLINFVKTKKFFAVFRLSGLKPVLTFRYFKAWVIATLITLALTALFREISNLYLFLDFFLLPVSSFTSMIISFTIMADAVSSFR